MVKVLVIGAIGYIGKELCQFLRRDGHRVFGLAHTPEKALQLAMEEAFVIRGTVEEREKYVTAIENYSIDVVVDLSGNASATDEILAAISETARSRSTKRGSYNKLAYIYVSSIWVHGPSVLPTQDLDELRPDRIPSKLVEWRRATEKKVLLLQNIMDVLILRTGMVYGRTGHIWSYLFNPILEGAKLGKTDLIIKLDKNAMTGLVHVDDVAQGIVKAVECVSTLSPKTYPVFDLVSSYESLYSIVKLASEVLGYRGKIHIQDPSQNDLWMKALSTTVNTDCHRARQILNWQPTRIGMAADIDIYVSSWSAAA